MSDSTIEVRLPDGSARRFPAGIKVREVAEDIGAGLARHAIAGELDGNAVDLEFAIERDADLRILTVKDEQGLHVFRHSSAHLLAAAVKELFPKAKYGIGPPIENGFFYDFEVDQPFTPEDLDKIEKKMKELAKAKLPYTREEIPKSEAIAAFADMGEDLKVELIQEKGGDVVSCYRLGEFYDFCEGPHVPHSGVLKAIKVLGSSAAYWKGDETNRPLQRIYATTFPDKKELAEHLHRLEEAKKRDHRKLGKELSLFQILPQAPGQVFWLPKGQRIVNLLTGYMRDKLERRGYQEVKTPLILDEQLWQLTGHIDHYRENMYFVEGGEENEPRFGLKPMNCPGAALIYQSSLRSYRELPLRLAEFGHCHRFERSGVLSGLTRVRSFIQDDAHIYCTMEQVGAEVEDLIALVLEVYGDFGFEGVRVELSTKPESAIGTDQQWEQAESALLGALESSSTEFKLNPGDGAFYGPKIDFHVQDAIGRSHQCATIQLDFFQAERFGLNYAAEDGSRKRPVTIHRAILGSVERFIAVLIEHTAGAFPLWLAPVQAVVVPIAERHHDYAGSVVRALREAGFRAELDDRNEKMGRKIREAQLQKVPLMLIAGDDEVEKKTVAVRNRRDGDQGPSSLEELIGQMNGWVETKSLSP